MKDLMREIFVTYLDDGTMTMRQLAEHMELAYGLHRDDAWEMACLLRPTCDDGMEEIQSYQ